MRKARFSRGSSRPARPMDWYHSESAGFNPPNTHSAAWHILPSVIQPDLTDPTLMAARAFVGMRTLSYSTALGAFVGIGLIAWNYVDDATPLQIPSVQAPDGDFDWIARWVGIVHPSTLPGTDLNPNIFDNTHLVKARRRLGNDRSLLVVFQTVAVSAYIALDLRTLIKE